jgi:hypothetical protein
MIESSAGHWGWFTISGATLILTATISGLFSSLEDDLLDVSWLPGLLRSRPFFIGFFLLYVPCSTVNACRASLQQFDAEAGSKHGQSRVRFGNRLLLLTSDRPR